MANEARQSEQTPTVYPGVPIKVLCELLDTISPVDIVAMIREQAVGEQSAAVKQKHFLVCIVEHVIECAKAANLNLCQRQEFVYAYDGTKWTQIEKETLRNVLALAAEKMGYTRIEANYYEFKDKLLKQFMSAAHLPEPVIEKETVLVNFQNGTLEITPQSRILREHRPSDFLTYELPFRYDKHATCPLFMKYLNEVQPEQESQNILAEFIGYALTRHLKLEKCLLAYGEGANGKSVLFDIVNALMGRQNVSTLSLGHLKEEHNRAMLVNKLLNYGSEINSNALEVDLLKQLVSGEPVQARLKYGNSFMMETYTKLAFNCNTLPQVTEHSEAFFRRFLIMPFDIKIREENRNPNLAGDIIKSELAGVFNWVLNGLDNLLVHGKFTVSPKVKEAVAAYRIASDTVASFLNEMEIVPSNNGEMKFSDLYDKYKCYCATDGYRAVSKKTFSERLKRLGYEHTRKSAGIVLHAHYQPSKIAA